MSGFLDDLPREERNRAKRSKMPTATAPMLATLTDDHFSDPDWIYERKLDGVRILAFRKGGEARLVSRNGKERNPTYPELVDSLQAASGPDLIADGEVVAFEGEVTSFSRLQHRMGVGDENEARERAKEVAIFFYLFDLLHLDGHDVTKLPLRSRKRLLRKAVDFEDPVRWTVHRNEEGEAYLEEACRKGWEGLIAKKADSEYVYSRSRNWLKFKCVHQQELVIGGWTDPQGERIGLGALLVGYYEEGILRYAGKIGTGYDDETLRELSAKLQRLERKTPPFEIGGEIRETGVHWATPTLVCEAGFTEWTESGRLRHPRYLGLRDGKKPEGVVRERA